MINEYFDDHFPKAIAAAEEARRAGQFKYGSSAFYLHSPLFHRRCRR